MTTEETELTFIHCPGCRSLIPAVAKRCRMCGQVMNDAQSAASEAAADDDASEKKSRVRQRTITVEGDEVEGIKEQYGLQESTPDTGEIDVETVSSALESAPPEPAPPEPAPPEPAPQPSLSESSPSSAPSIIDNIIQNVDDMESSPAADSPPPEVNKTEGKDHQRSSSASDSGNGNPALEENDGSRKKRRRKRKRKRKRSDVEFQAGVDGEVAQNTEERLDDTGGEKDAIETANVEDAKRKHSQAAVQVKPQGFHAKPEVKLDNSAEKKQVMTQVNQAERRFDENRSKSRDRKSEAGFSPAVSSSAELVGWLVRFHDDIGTAIEIRAGRFFVGSDRVKDTDLVINDPTVSAPHCILRVLKIRISQVI